MINVRPQLTQDNPYWISRHRYYELKHFCLQYYLWKSKYNEIDISLRSVATDSSAVVKSDVSNPTEDLALTRLHYKEHMELIERTAEETDPIIGHYIFIGVTEGVSYEIIDRREPIPCCKNEYYNLYRRFFWLLDKARG